MSTTEKSRTVGQGRPSFAVPSAGILSVPAWTAALAAWKKAGALQYANWPKIEPRRPLTQLPWRSALVLRAERSVRLAPLKPNHSATVEPAGTLAAAGAAIGCVPRSITSGLYSEIWPAGVMIAPCTNADWSAFASSHAPLLGFVATSWYGVARPAADRGSAGTMRVQSMLASAAWPAAMYTAPPATIEASAARIPMGFTSRRPFAGGAPSRCSPGEPS